MAIRNTAGRRIPDEPFAGLMRQTVRQARRSSRRGATSAPVQGEPGATGEAGPPGEQGPPGVSAATAVAVLTCDETGVATWYDDGVTAASVVVVTPVADVPRFATVQQVGEGFATVAVWALDGDVAPGATVHVAAFPGPAVETVEPTEPTDLPAVDLPVD